MLKGDDGYPSPVVSVAQMDMSSELANQAAAEAAVAAAITEAASAAERAEAAAEQEQAHEQAKALAQAQAQVQAHVEAASVSLGDREHDDAQAPDSVGVSVTASPAPMGPSIAVTDTAAPTTIHLPLPRPGHGPSLPPTFTRSRGGGFTFGAPHRQAPDSPLSNAQQLLVLREFYSRNPNPGKKDLEILAERTGRPWNKIREYFRQRRNKLRGLVDLEGMEEPGRATGWLQVTYRAGPSTATVSQLSLYNAYKTRFDPYAAQSPLMGGQELIQLACATFPGCEMARDEGDYVLRGLRDKDGAAAEAEWERGVDALVEPLRGTTWLLNHFQHQSDPTAPPSVSQTELYSAYAARFSSLLPDAEDEETTADELKEFEADMGGAGDDAEMDDINSFLPPAADDDAQAQSRDEDSSTSGGAGVREHRMLNPVELITLARMTFPKAEPAIDEDGRFVIRGLERRDGVEKGRAGRSIDMFPFALAAQPTPSDPAHPFTALLKRKLALLAPEPEPKRRAVGGIGVNIGVPVGVAQTQPEPELELTDEERELLEGLQRFKGSRLGREVRDVCVQQ